MTLSNDEIACKSSMIDFEELNQRLRELEYKVLSNDSLFVNEESVNRKLKPFTKTVSENEQILFRIQKLTDKFSLLENSHIREMYHKYADLLDIHELESFFEEQKGKEQTNNFKDGKVIDFDLMFNKADKLQILFGEEKMVDNMCKSLERLEHLMPYIQSEFHNSVSQVNREQILPLARKYDASEREAIKMSLRLQTLIAQYNEIISLLSHKFVHWDKTLTSMEKQVNRILQERSKNQ